MKELSVAALLTALSGMAFSQTVVAYENLQNSTGTHFFMGGGNGNFSRTFIDDVQLAEGPEILVTRYAFTLHNARAQDRTGGYEILFWDDADGTPGIFLGRQSRDVFMPAQSTIIAADHLFSPVPIPESRRLWVGVRAYNETVLNANATGIVFHGPATVGSSEDRFLLGSFLNGPIPNNPTGDWYDTEPNLGSMGLRLYAAPVPEPGTMAVLALGLAALARRRRS